MAISKMKIWRTYYTMRAFNMVSKVMRLINIFRTEHPAAAFRARGTPGMYTSLVSSSGSNRRDSYYASD